MYYYIKSVIPCIENYWVFALLQDTTMSELKTRVDELKMENEYQLRLKDMNYGEKIKELTDNFLQEIDALKAKNEVRRDRFKFTINMYMCMYALFSTCN